MRRVTVAVTLPSTYWGTGAKKIKAAMINAAIGKATELDEEIISVDAKSANNVRNRHPA